MQGDKIAETSGKVTSQRVLANPGGGPKMESSFAAGGKLLGVDETETGTYWAAVRPDGTLYGEGQGIIMAKEGDVATSRLNSVARVFEYEVDAQGNTGAQIWEWK